MDTSLIVIAVITIVVLIIMYLSTHEKIVKKRCAVCDRTSFPITRRKGYFALEIVLWILFILPGIVYSVWRLCAPKDVKCPHCGSVNKMIPVERD